MNEYIRAKQEQEERNRQNPEPVPQAASCDENVKCCESGDNTSKVVKVEEKPVDETEDTDIFRPVIKKIKTGLNTLVNILSQGTTADQPEIVNVYKVPQNAVKIENTLNSAQNKVKSEPDSIPEPKEPRVPKIYFCTRTHKQLAQVVNELRRTAYKDAKNTLLASRTHACIHDGLTYNPRQNKTELCRQLLDPRSGMGCRFHKNVRNYHVLSDLQAQGLETPWELEDLVVFGKKRTVCPYFVARELMADADIIFCPYNYLIDPLVRNSMKIDLKGSIIIVDEAHNIEDTCRESASLTVMQDNVQNAIQECEEVLESLEETSEKRGPCQEIINTLCSLSTWIDRHKNNIAKMSDYDQGKFDMFGPTAVESFKDYKFGPSHFAAFANNYAALTTEEKVSIEELNMEEEVSTITGPTKALLEGLLLVLSILYNPTYTNDYRIVLIKSFNQQYDQEPETTGDGWFVAKKKKKIVSRWNYSLNFWCFNPATTFSSIKESARCVVLSSGTLSPTTSFQSELGALFPITLEANHVIDANQCWVASLGSGPNKLALTGTYASTSTYPFQDEIGRILLNICSFVPHGVLCFVSSYFLLDKLCERWNSTGITEEIAKHKKLLCEPRRGDQLDELLKDFYETIETTADNVVGQQVTGALFMAVCRGKVSEGLDFADKNARVVVTIGIPYPSIKDDQVNMKKSYNDSHKNTKALLSGHAWYEIQAYRALNQALGRCIRHRRDWGAILLIDSRFRNDQYYKSLSKWVRTKVSHHHDYSEMIDSLSTFIENRLRIDKQNAS
ncbi:Fanconi anemia group J protein homolog isoform X2 [Planococcus citri]